MPVLQTQKHGNTPAVTRKNSLFIWSKIKRTPRNPAILTLVPRTPLPSLPGVYQTTLNLRQRLLLTGESVTTAPWLCSTHTQRWAAA